jgi:hypothetical protein
MRSKLARIGSSLWKLSQLATVYAGLLASFLMRLKLRRIGSSLWKLAQVAPVYAERHLRVFAASQRRRLFHVRTSGYFGRG